MSHINFTHDEESETPKMKRNPENWDRDYFHAIR